MDNCQRVVQGKLISRVVVNVYNSIITENPILRQSKITHLYQSLFLSLKLETKALTYNKQMLRHGNRN